MNEKISIIRTKQVCEKLSIGTTTLHTRYMKDPSFPKCIKLGGNNAWNEADIDAWLVEKLETKQKEVTA